MALDIVSVISNVLQEPINFPPIHSLITGFHQKCHSFSFMLCLGFQLGLNFLSSRRKVTAWTSLGRQQKPVSEGPEEDAAECLFIAV